MEKVILKVGRVTIEKYTVERLPIKVPMSTQQSFSQFVKFVVRDIRRKCAKNPAKNKRGDT
jgi:hypothetical protein